MQLDSGVQWVSMHVCVRVWDMKGECVRVHVCVCMCISMSHGSAID